MSIRKEDLTVAVPVLLDIASLDARLFQPEGSLAAELGLSPRLLLDPDGRAPLAALMRVWGLVVKRRGAVPSASLFARRPPQTAGLPELFAGRVAPEVFLSRMARHQAEVNPAVPIRVSQIDDELEVRISVPDSWDELDGPAAAAFSIGLLGWLLQTTARLYGPVAPVLVRTNSGDARFREFLGGLTGRAATRDPSGHSVRYRLADLSAQERPPDCIEDLLDAAARREWSQLDEKPDLETLRAWLESPASVGNGPSLWAESCRIICRSALRSTFLSTRELSVILGFSSHQTFARTFKRLEGTPPREWRKKHAVYRNE